MGSKKPDKAILHSSRGAASSRHSAAPKHPCTGRMLLAAAAALWTWTPLALAAPQENDSGSPPPADPVRYTVELIVFTYADTSSAGNEIFLPERRPVEDDPLAPGASQDDTREPVFDDRTLQPNTDGLDGRDDGSTALQELPASARIELRKLEPDEFQMTDTYGKLARLDAYRPILHAAWTQSTHDKDLSPTLPLRALGEPPIGLDGTVTLYQSRFLHLDVDLSLDAGPDASRSARSATDRLVRGETPDLEPAEPVGNDGLLQLPVRYRIVEDRIMREGEIRYFDHPRFGMLARVTRVDPQAPAGSE